MAQLHFPINLGRQIDCPNAELPGASVGELLDHYFTQRPLVKGYVLDDQGMVRKHIVILVDGVHIRDRCTLSDPISRQSQVHIFQALSGG